MQRMVYVPPGGNVELPETCVEFSLAPPYIIGSVTGTGGPETTVISSSVPGVDGVFVHGIRTESREVTCFIHVDGEDRKDMYRKRFELIKKLTPGQEPGLLYYFNDYTVKRIAAFPQSSPSFTERIQNYNRAELRFLCPSPYWEDTVAQSGYMAYIDGGFRFPFQFKPSISFAALRNRTSLTNAGSVAAPVEITIRGPATNPAVVNETTGERFQVRRDLAEGETLQIRTKRGEKSVQLFRAGQEPEDAFQYIDLRSTFFQLVPGVNALRYESDNETEHARVTVRFREWYAGV